MQSLGDFLPEEIKENLSELRVKNGAVLRFDTSFPDGTTKPKRQIIVGFDKENVVLASVFINTEINPNVFPTEELKDLHLELTSNGRDYLDHTSFVDCSSLSKYNVDDIKKILKSTPSIYIGEVSNDDFDVILDKIGNANTITKKDKKTFGLI